jgi:hypothetical protein
VSDEEPTNEALSNACAELVKLWHSREQINPDRQLDGYHDARLHSVNGLAAHAYRTGEVGNRLLREGLWLESAPIVRTSYECAITARWAAQIPDGIQALLNEDYRSRRNMADSLQRSESWTASGLVVRAPDDEDHETFSNLQARNFKQMCDDLSPGGAEAYSFYRTLCWYSHPTNYVADCYTDLLRAQCGSPRLRLRRTPRPEKGLAHTFHYFCAVSLVTAASAMNFLDADKMHNDQIVQIAERVGIAPDMRLTDKARARVGPESANG